MSVENLSPARPELSRGDSIAAVTTYAIDQVIVDGMVDGAERRVPRRVLSGLAFDGERVPRPTLLDFYNLLIEDERHIDVLEQNYGYHPILLGETAAKARPEAVISGRGIYSEEERQDVMERMESYMQAIHARLRHRGKVVDLKAVSGELNQSGFRLSRDEFTGLLAYIREGKSPLTFVDKTLFKVADVEKAGRQGGEENSTAPRSIDELIVEGLGAQSLNPRRKKRRKSGGWRPH